MAEDTEADAVAELAVLAQTPKILDPNLIATVVRSASDVVEVLDGEKYLPAPKARRGSVTLYTGGSLSDYVNRHKNEETVLYADVVARTITAVVNDHAGNAAIDGSYAGWADHRAELRLRHDPTWERWTRHDGQLMDQQSFAELIEVGFPDITAPPAADMLELAQTLQATVKADFRSQTILANGQRQIAYEETSAAKAGAKGQLEIPASFNLALIPFEGSATYPVVANLRFRLTDGVLRIGYVLQRPEDVLREAFADILSGIVSDTEVLALCGAAPAPRR
jgi:uncharacterized protein YfdQ (DUF2303 family)